METWEKILRHELNELVPDGLYTIGEGEFKAQTGKGGYIEYRVELCRALFFTNGLYSSINAENPTTNKSSVVDNIEDETINFSPAYIANRWGKPFQFIGGFTSTYKEVPCCAVCKSPMIVYPMASDRPYCGICEDLVDEGTTKILI